MAEKLPLISIFTNVMNARAHIRRCVESVLALDYPNIEYIIQDGASTDGTKEILEEYAAKHPGIIKLVSQRDSGADEGFFRALRRCSGDYIGSCLADEALLPTAGRWAVQAFRLFPKAGAVYGDMYMTDEDGKAPKEWKPPTTFTAEAYVLHQMNPPFASSFFRRAALDAIDLQKHQWTLFIGEFELWLRLGMKFPVQYMPGLVTNYAVYPNQRSSRKDILMEMLEHRLLFLERFFQTPEAKKHFGEIQSQAYAGTFLITAEVLRDFGHFKEAAELFLKANTFKPAESHNKRLMVGFYGRGQTLIQEKRYQDAYLCWEPLVRIGVSIPQFAELKARCLEASGEAATMFKEIKSGPLVTVVVLGHNYAHYLPIAVESVIAQTYENWELVILDDGSTDNSPKVIAELLGQYGGKYRMRSYRLEDVGPSAARRFGVEKAEGEFYVPLDADDKLAPSFLGKTVPLLLADPKLGFAYVDSVYFGDSQQRVYHQDYSLAKLYHSNYIAYASLIRRSAFLAVDGYDRQNWGYYEDWDLWMRLGDAGWQGRHVPEPLFFYNFHFGSSLSYFAKRLDAIYKAYIHMQRPQNYSAELVATSKALLAEMAPGWHALPPLRSSATVRERLATAPGNRHLLYFLAAMLFKEGKFEEAEKAAQGLLGVFPADSDAQTLLMEIQRKRAGEDPAKLTPAGEAKAGDEAGTQAVQKIRVIALISAYNEGDVIYHVIGDLIENGLEVYLIDNASTDNTIEEASRWLGKGLLKVERFPEEAGAGYSSRCSKEYVWMEILRRKEELSLQLGGDWYIHADADEFREGPWPGLTLAEAIRKVDRLGYSAINFELLNFRPTDDGFIPGTDVRKHLVSYEIGEIFDALQIKAWKNPGVRVEIGRNGGHSINFPGRKIFPIHFILRHYPIRGETHGRRKVFKDRLPRFAAEEVAHNWHIQYNEFVHGQAKFLFDPAKLALYDVNVERARLLGRFADDLLLTQAVSTNASFMAPMNMNALSEWVRRSLGLAKALPSEMLLEAEKALAKLLPTQEKGVSSVEVRLDPLLVRVLLAMLELRHARSRLEGNSHAAYLCARLESSLRSKHG